MGIAKDMGLNSVEIRIFYGFIRNWEDLFLYKNIIYQ